ncbi:MAG: hypothetical protein LQ347_002574 [Umbilicaria vellea]|nr:MAG: hypothetical protein LQ347_002574 [Umbilicaria vellea]
MRLSKLTAVAILAAASHAEIDASACEAASTVYVTVSGAPTIETIDLVDAPSSIISTASSVKAQPYIWTGVTPADTSKEIIAIFTSYVTYTEVISIAEAPTALATADQGPYYFSEENGTTAWLSDKTPPATDALVTGTTTVVVEPIQSSLVTSSGLINSAVLATSSGVPLPSGPTSTVLAAPATSTSFSTIFLTLFSTKQITETVTETTFTVPTSTRNFAGLGSSGWNNSLTTLQTVKVGWTISGASTQWDGQKAVPYTIIHTLQSGYSSSLSKATASGYVPKNKMERQVGAIVYATINGVAVSWTNDFDGGSIPTSTLSTSSYPVVVASPYAFSLTAPEITPATSAVSSAAAAFSSVVTTPLLSNASTTASASSATSSCLGQFGDFTITFDDLPRFDAGPDNTDYPPLFSPYHDLFWSQGFAYAPPPSDPFLPISSPQLAVFIVNASANVHSVDSSGGGGFSAGLNVAESAFWVDAYGAYMGCNDGGPVECVVKILGYTYSSATDNPDPSFIQTVTLPPCPGLVNCTLTPVTFAADFRSLTGLEIIATIGGTPVTWFLDDLRLRWSNNTCAAGLRRVTLPL